LTERVSLTTPKTRVKTERKERKYRYPAFWGRKKGKTRRRGSASDIRQELRRSASRREGCQKLRGCLWKKSIGNKWGGGGVWIVLLVGVWGFLGVGFFFWSFWKSGGEVHCFSPPHLLRTPRGPSAEVPGKGARKISERESRRRSATPSSVSFRAGKRTLTDKKEKQPKKRA